MKMGNRNKTKREDEGKRATLKPECMKTLILYILFHNTFKIIFPLKQSLSKCPYEPRSQPKLTVLQICTTVSLKRLEFLLPPLQLLHPKDFTHSTILINRFCWFQETFFLSILVKISLLFFCCIKFRIKNIKAASTSDLTFRGSMWQGSPW